MSSNAPVEASAGAGPAIAVNPDPPGGLRFGPLGPRSIHLSIDMQAMFAEPTPWHTPWMARVLPAVEELARRRPNETVFTRFIPPGRAEEMPGAWRRYYRRWRAMTRDEIDPRLLELVPSLASFVPPATVIDKRVYSPFVESGLLSHLRSRRADTIVISGAETDVCVLATVLGAVDLGYRVIIAADAVCSSSDTTHDALLTLYRSRFSEQIEIADTAAILAQWPSA